MNPPRRIHRRPFPFPYVILSEEKNLLFIGRRRPAYRLPAVAGRQAFLLTLFILFILSSCEGSSREGSACEGNAAKGLPADAAHIRQDEVSLILTAILLRHQDWYSMPALAFEAVASPADKFQKSQISQALELLTDFLLHTTVLRMETPKVHTESIDIC